MGLKIWDILLKQPIELSELAHKKFSVDASPILYQFLTSIRQPDGTPLMDAEGNVTSHLMGLSTRIPRLMNEGLQLVFCFDGKPPVLKVHEQEQREHKKMIAEQKMEEAREEGDYEDMLKYSKQTVRLNKDIIKESKELLHAFGIPTIQSPSESEAQCAYMAKQQDVWGVITQDADTLLYGAPRIVRNLTLSQRRKTAMGYTKVIPEIVDLQQTLKELQLNQEQLIAIALLIGTDYHEGIKGIGQKKALKLVKQYPKIKQLFKHVETNFNWETIYKTFTTMPIEKKYKLSWEPPDLDKIHKILVEQHNFSEERVAKIFAPKGKKIDKSQKGLKDFF